MRNNPARNGSAPAWRARAAAVAAALFVSACGALPPAPGEPAQTGRSLYLEPADFKDLPGWLADDPIAALDAFRNSCPAIAKQPADKPLGYEALQGTMGDIQKICQRAQGVAETPAAARFFLESSFRPYRVRDISRDVGTFTGYYEPLLRGSWQPDQRYRYPVYARPRDLIVADLEDFDSDRKGEQIAGRIVDQHLVPYYDRKEIEQGILQGRQLEIMWVDNPIDLFFLHVQGSGRVRLPDGSDVRLAFSGRNGRRYTPIGRELVAMGVFKPDQVSLASLRAWMAQNPVAADALMLRNKSYIFFRVEKTDVVKGALGVPLTAGRSLAVDPKYIPLGLPLYLVTTDPLDPKHQRPLRRMVVAQDTGSAIKGIVRGDLFWGFGAKAETSAGSMNEKGSYFLMLPRHPAL